MQAVDGIFHVCRAFDDADVVHVEDRVDPVEGRYNYYGSSCFTIHDDVKIRMVFYLPTQIWKLFMLNSEQRI